MVAFIPSRKIRMSCIRMTLVFRIRWLSIAASGGQATQSMFSGGGRYEVPSDSATLSRMPYARVVELWNHESLAAGPAPTLMRAFTRNRAVS